MRRIGRLGVTHIPQFTRVHSPLVEPKTRDYRKRNVNANRRSYEDKPFIAWDGEGWTDHQDDHRLSSMSGECAGGCVHNYCLFGASTGHYVREASLSTVQCLDLMLVVAAENPGAIHVGYAFKYDANMILRDLPVGRMRRLCKSKRVQWNGYHLEWIPGKWFQVSRLGTSCRIQDIFSFFGTSFVKSLKAWKVGTDQEWKAIEAGKDSRGDFTLEQLDEFVIPYWRGELRLLVSLSDNLRDVLYSGGFHIDKWYGPGAIASHTYTSRGTKAVMAQCPDEVVEASCHAYAGGRFEGFRAGYYEGPVYSADINSAYPYALSKMPNLATGRWSHIRDQGSLSRLVREETRCGLFHVSYVLSYNAMLGAKEHGLPGPLFHRGSKGQFGFPVRNEGVWVHAPEFFMIKEMWEKYGEKFLRSYEIKEAWVFSDDGTYPFAWVGDLYDQRAQWKREGNPAQLAAKLGLNSLYGKLAQRVGGTEGKIPPWHQLEWAGAITSTCRAMLYEASCMDNEGLIAYETDGIYSTLPFSSLRDGDKGDALGQWKVEEYTGILFLQNGMYWLRDGDGVWLPPKTRGIPQKHVEFDRAYEALRDEVALEVEQSQFIGFGLADMRRGRGWRTWERNTKTIEFGGGGKRWHRSDWCPECKRGVSLLDGLHPLQVYVGGHGESAPHSLPWRDDRIHKIEQLKLFNEHEVME
jgi:hypothetical protein